MVLMPLGDFYAWYCEWCDSRNLTLWTKVEKNAVACSACHKSFSFYEESPSAQQPGGVQRQRHQLL